MCLLRATNLIFKSIWPNTCWFFGRATSLSVIYRTVNVEVLIRSKVSKDEVCGDKRGTGTGLSASSSVFPLGIIPLILHSHLHIHIALTRRTNGQSLGTSQKTKKSFENPGAFHRKVLQIFVIKTIIPVFQFVWVSCRAQIDTWF
jgi:hypothetical protein